MRINPSINASVNSAIEQSQQAVTNAFEQVSTGLRVNQPSDDPSAYAAYTQLQAESASVDQYTSNAGTALSQAQLSDQVLSQVVSALNEAVTLGTSGANSTNSATDRASTAADVQGVLSSVVGFANTKFQGVSLFGGTANPQQAFVADAASPTGYTYTGNNGTNQVQVGDSLSVQTGIPGSTLFDNSPTTGVLGALSNLVTALQTGTSAQIGTATAAITTALNYVTSQHAVFGNTINQLNSQETYLSQETVTLTSQAQSLVGISAATAAENLTQAEASNSSVLAAAAKIIQNTLLTYLQ